MVVWLVLAAMAGILAVLWWLAGSSRPARRAPSPRSLKPTVAAKARVHLQAVGTATDASAAQAGRPAPQVPDLVLLDEQTLSPEGRECLEAVARNSPRPRTVLLQLLHAGGDPAELARVVAGDPSAAALLLRTVNSAQFQLAHEITSVQRAITYLGANLVRDIAIRHALAAPAGANTVVEGVHELLWSSSYLASAIAFAVAQQARLGGAAELSTQALLFGLGDIALVTHQPHLARLYLEDCDLPTRVDTVQRESGCNAALAGAQLGAVWQLPQSLCRVLGASLAPLTTAPQGVESDLLQGVALGYFANRLAEILSAQTRFDLPAGLAALPQRPEAALLPDWLAAGGLGDAVTLLADPGLERRLESVHASIGARRPAR